MLPSRGNLVRTLKVIYFNYPSKIRKTLVVDVRRLSLIQSISDQKQVSDHTYGNKSAILSKSSKGTCKAAVGIKHNTNGLTGEEVVFIGNSIQPTKHLSAASGGNTTTCIRSQNVSEMHLQKLTPSLVSIRLTAQLLPRKYRHG